MSTGHPCALDPPISVRASVLEKFEGDCCEVFDPARCPLKDSDKAETYIVNGQKPSRDRILLGVETGRFL